MPSRLAVPLAPNSVSVNLLRKGSVKLAMVYDQSLKWQRLSFDALRVFEKNDDLFQLRFA